MSPSGSGGNGGMNGTSYRSQSPELDSPSRGHGADRDRYIYVSKMRERPYKEKYIGKFLVIDLLQHNTSAERWSFLLLQSYIFDNAQLSICYRVLYSWGSIDLTRGQWHSGFPPWIFLATLLKMLREEFHSWFFIVFFVSRNWIWLLPPQQEVWRQNVVYLNDLF